MSKIKAGIESFRRWVHTPSVQRWLVPYSKPLAGTITGVITAAAVKLDVLDLGTVNTYAPVVAGAIVAYFVPEARRAVTEVTVTPPIEVMFTPEDFDAADEGVIIDPPEAFHGGVFTDPTEYEELPTEKSDPPPFDPDDGITR